MQEERDINDLIIFSGNSNPLFAQKICEYLNMKLGKAKVKTFSDGEIQIEIGENVRSGKFSKKDVYVIQSTCATNEKSVNDHLIELILMIDALKRSSAERITAVIPYYGYARQDKKVAPRVPISARVVADMIEVAGANRVITMDLHAGQIQGFFNIPVDHLYARPITLKEIAVLAKGNPDNLVIVSPDAGGVDRARAFAKRLGAGLAIVDKRRDEPNKAKAMAIIGDVMGKIAVILDDMIDTAGTLTEAETAIKEKGAIEVHACCTHPVLSGQAIDRINASSVNSIITTDTMPLSDRAIATGKIKVASVHSLFAEAIYLSHTGGSVTALF